MLQPGSNVQGQKYADQGTNPCLYEQNEWKYSLGTVQVYGCVSIVDLREYRTLRLVELSTACISGLHRVHVGEDEL